MSGCIGRSHPMFLVQARSHGEPWKTTFRYDDQPSATRKADALAKERSRFRWVDGPPEGYPTHPYVRVTFKGAVVYDPRAVHVEQRTPAASAAPDNPLA